MAIRRSLHRRAASSQKKVESNETDVLAGQPQYRTGGFDLEDGLHDFEVLSAVVEKDREGFRRVIWELQEIDGEGNIVGRPIKKINQIRTKDNRDWLYTEMFNIGLCDQWPDDMTTRKLAEMLEPAAGMSIRGRAYHRDERCNLIFTEALAEAETKESEDEEESEESEEAKTEEEAGYSREDIEDMGKDDLADIAKELGLKAKKYSTTKELRKAVMNELGL